jgi:hypothetical protein
LKILATYCSAQKDEQLDPLPAYQRYQSDRIKIVIAKAEDQNVSFMILSGKFGLIHFDQPLPYYDHLLKPFEVEEHANFVAMQITENGISEIEFYSRSIEEDPNLQAYHDCMKQACQLAKVSLNVIHDTFQE